MSTPNTCSKCGKPVYFAERKTSLGKDWHPSCLRCEECGKILAPGQHAEHKGIPYCHPCYNAHFGPQMVGYGSNVFSHANYRKSGLPSLESIDEQQPPDGITCIFQTNSNNPGPIGKPQVSVQRRHSDVGSGVHQKSSQIDPLEIIDDSRMKMIFESSASRQRAPAIQINGQQSPRSPLSHSPRQSHTSAVNKNYNSQSKIEREEIRRRVEGYNKYHENKRGQALKLKEDEGSLVVEGPLRIFWGLKNPIMLRQYDDIPVNPTPRKRYSVIPDNIDQQPTINEIQKSENSPISRISGIDDSILTSPGFEVVRRNQIRKSNTVAYRGDRANKWKRASINGHIYNFDTSVFTPVLGSCTSVTVDSKMTVLEVIRTLLDKFKVENEPNEYNLYIITEREGERTLNIKDIPLLERLSLGPSDSAKIFIRDRKDVPPIFPPSAIPDHTPDETPLPEEVEQLVLLPEPVLRGLLEKFVDDERRDTHRIHLKYDRIKKKLKRYMEERKLKQSA